MYFELGVMVFICVSAHLFSFYALRQKNIRARATAKFSPSTATSTDLVAISEVVKKRQDRSARAAEIEKEQGGLKQRCFSLVMKGKAHGLFFLFIDSYYVAMVSMMHFRCTTSKSTF